MCQSLFFNKEACNFIKKRGSCTGVSCEFCKIFKNIFFAEYLRATFAEHLRATTSEVSISKIYK